MGEGEGEGEDRSEAHAVDVDITARHGTARHGTTWHDAGTDVGVVSKQHDPARRCKKDTHARRPDDGQDRSRNGSAEGHRPRGKKKCSVKGFRGGFRGGCKLSFYLLTLLW